MAIRYHMVFRWDSTEDRGGMIIMIVVIQIRTNLRIIIMIPIIIPIIITTLVAITIMIIIVILVGMEGCGRRRVANLVGTGATR